MKMHFDFSDVPGVEVVVLESIENQLGKNVITDAITYISHEGIFIRETLLCLSSEHINNGICRCINHNTYQEKEISFTEACEAIKFSKRGNK